MSHVSTFVAPIFAAFFGACVTACTLDVDIVQGGACVSSALLNSLTSNEWIDAAVVDGQGNILIAGRFSGTLRLGPDKLVSVFATPFIAKLDPQGRPIWGIDTIGNLLVDKLSIDTTGRIKVGAYVDGIVGVGNGSPLDGGQKGYLTFELDEKNGNYLTGTVGPRPPETLAPFSSNEAWPVFLARDEEGYEYAAGSFVGCGACADGFVTKSDKNHSQQWLKTFGHTDKDPGAGGKDSCDGMTVDAAGNVTISGIIGSDTSFGGGLLEVSQGCPRDTYVAQLDRDGRHRWSTQLRGIYPHSQRPGLFPAANGEIVLATLIDRKSNELHDDDCVAGAEDDGSWMFQKFGANGSLYWEHAWGRGADVRTWVTLVDTQGNLIIVGTFIGTLDFGCGPMTTDDLIRPQIFIAKLSP